jgi:uncharacterized protein
VKPGDIVRVKVLEVDKARKRVALTLRLDDEVGPKSGRSGAASLRNERTRSSSRSAPPGRLQEQSGGALADALRRAGLAEKRK